jgi:hypothetical protein
MEGAVLMTGSSTSLHQSWHSLPHQQPALSLITAQEAPMASTHRYWLTMGAMLGACRNACVKAHSHPSRSVHPPYKVHMCARLRTSDSPNTLKEGEEI